MKYGIRDMKHPTLAHFRHFSSLYTNLRSTPVENVRQITPFYAKQTQFCAFIARKRRFHEKTKPIQTQFKPKQTQSTLYLIFSLTSYLLIDKIYDLNNICQNEVKYAAKVKFSRCSPERYWLPPLITG